MFKSIHSRLTMVHAVTFGMLLLTVIVFLYVSFNYILNDFLDKNLLNAAKTLEYSIFHPPPKHHLLERIKKDFGDILTKEDIAKVDKILDKNMRGEADIQERLNFKLDRVFFFAPVYVQVREVGLDQKGIPAIVARSNSLNDTIIPLDKKNFQKVLSGETVYQIVVLRIRERIRVVSFLVNDRNNRQYILQLGLPSQQIQKMMKQLLFFIFIIVPIVLTLVAVGGDLFVKRAFKPVTKIVNTVNSITSDDLSLRVENPASQDEIGELTATFNRMIDRLETSFKSIKEFSGNASHELKTPLTVIRGEIEVALRKNRSTVEYQDILKTVQTETFHLQAIVNDLLFLSRMDGGAVSFSFSEISVDEVLLDAYEENCQAAEDKGIKIVLNSIDPVCCNGNRTLLKRLFANLIHNAVKYTDSKGTIEIQLNEDKNGRARMVVSDTGIGIPAEAIPNIFDSFFRVEHSRSDEDVQPATETGGAGLGLAIVKKIVELHRADIEVDSEEGNGTAFTITFPPCG